MKEKYCAFLRGINVNGIKIKMQELKEVLSELGFIDVQTILATGNVVFSMPEGEPSKVEIKSTLEKGLSEHFKYEAHVILRSQSDVEELFSLAKTYNVPEDYQHYLLLCNDPVLPQELSQLFETMTHSQEEELILAKSDLFWIVPKGETLLSNFGSKVLGSKKYKDKLTSRNINTIEKICHLFSS